MIAYLDTSVVVPLLVAEPISERCRELWSAADDVVVTRLTYVEANAAIARAERLARLTPVSASAALALLDRLWDQVAVTELDEELMARSSLAARVHGLRGYDAVHCAAAAALTGPDVVAASGDRELLAAWHDLGMATFDPHGGA